MKSNQSFIGKDKKFRSRQGSNLRGETPLDFKSNALTTRPQQLTDRFLEYFSQLMGLIPFYKKRNFGWDILKVLTSITAVRPLQTSILQRLFL